MNRIMHTIWIGSLHDVALQYTYSRGDGKGLAPVLKIMYVSQIAPAYYTGIWKLLLQFFHLSPAHIFKTYSNMKMNVGKCYMQHS